MTFDTEYISTLLCGIQFIVLCWLLYLYRKSVRLDEEIVKKQAEVIRQLDRSSEIILKEEQYARDLRNRAHDLLFAVSEIVSEELQKVIIERVQKRLNERVNEDE